MTMTASRRVLPPLCIRASAGSGKTWALSDRYLGLIMAGAPVSSILATTFTRLAAGEIRDRILLRLVDAYEDPAARTALSSAIGFLTIDEARAADALRRVVGDLGRSQVRTLDSFFGAVAAAFALDLGLPPAAAILEEEEAIALRSEGIERVFEKRGADEMIPLLRRMTEGAPRGAQQAVNDVVTKLYELWLEADERAWAYAEAPDVLREAVERAIETVEDVVLPDEPRFEVRRGECLAHARERRWESLLENYLMTRIAEGKSRLYGMDLTPEVHAAFGELLTVARTGFRHQLGERAKVMRELLASYDGEYASLKRAAGVITFGDITRALANGADPALLEAIWYRIDARIEHLLLDEFQDTNVLQWRALAPLVEEVLSDETRERTFFCVGDSKQSIYGWRSACPEILASVAELPGVETKPLNASWRSTQVIIDVVNRVFGDLPSNAALVREPAATAFSRDWEEHVVAGGCKARGGYVELRVAGGEIEPLNGDEEGDGDESDDAAHGADTDTRRIAHRLDEAARLAARLLDEARGAEIAILTRTNPAVARVLHTLARAGVPASGRGGSPLVDAPAVEAVLDLLRLADHPGDTISAFNVAAGPLGPVVGLTVEECRPTTEAARARQSLAARFRRRLIDEGYATVIADLAHKVAGECDARQHQRLLQLVELAARWEPRSRLRTEPFIRLVETRRMEAARTAQIQVMTVHQAKGLGFDLVILPELERRLTGEDKAAWRRASSRSTGPGPIDAIVPWVSRDVRRGFPDLDALHGAHIARIVQEGLCVLYVAMTRAKRGLYMLIDPKKPRSRLSATAAGVLRSALAPKMVAAPGAVLYSHGIEASLFGGEEVAAPQRFEARAPIQLPAPSGTVGRGSAPAPSGAGRRLEEVLRLEDADAVDRGRALHALFEDVEWLEPGVETVAERARADGVRAGLVAGVLPRRDRAWIEAAVRDFHRAIDRPAVRALFARDALLPVEVRRERRFAMLAKDESGAGGRVLEGSIDRLEVWRDAGGRAAGARVIDFKTDRIEASLAASRAESYRRQLETYRSITARIHRLDPERIEMLVVFVEPGVVVKL